VRPVQALVVIFTLLSPVSILAINPVIVFVAQALLNRLVGHQFVPGDPTLRIVGASARTFGILRWVGRLESGLQIQIDAPLLVSTAVCTCPRARMDEMRWCCSTI
jgi:hypothetical protein